MAASHLAHISARKKNILRAHLLGTCPAGIEAVAFHVERLPKLKKLKILHLDSFGCVDTNPLCQVSVQRAQARVNFDPLPRAGTMGWVLGLIFCLLAEVLLRYV